MVHTPAHEPPSTCPPGTLGAALAHQDHPHETASLLAPSANHPSRFQQDQIHRSNGEDEVDSEDEQDDDDDLDHEGASEMQPILPARSTKRSKKPSSHGYEGVQHMYLEDEDIELTFTGYRFVPTWVLLYYLACLLSAGILFLLGRWMPRRYIAFVAEKCRMDLAEVVVVENEWGQLVVVPISTNYFGGSLRSIFTSEQLGRLDDDEGYAQIDASMLDDMRYFDYQYIRFIYNPVTHTFLPNSHWSDPEWTFIARCEQGLDRETHQERTKVFGLNLIDVEEKTVGQLLVHEVLHPFYVFQAVSMILWIAEDYYYYGVCILLISFVSIVTELIDTKKNVRRMRNMSKFTCKTSVLRSGRWRQLGSEELVPGDVFDITDSELSVFPCDAVLLTGDCIVNESMLTGESVPVFKSPITDRTLRYMDLSLTTIPSDLSRHFLFSGTKVIRARPGPIKPQQDVPSQETEYGVSEPARGLALVVRTGFNTSKGSLIRSMLFPKPNNFQFYRDSFRFIGILTCISFCGFIISVINFIRMDVPVKQMIIKATDLITIVVPPALPATMSIGTNFAIARLKRFNIFCISPTRVNMGGKINCMCFDKTGTLTEEGLDVLGVQCTDSAQQQFGPLLSSVDEMHNVTESMQDKCTSLLHAMTTCHSVKSLNGELIGEPLDLKMFEFTRWILEEDSLGSRISNVSDAARRSDAHRSGKGAASAIVSTVVRPPGYGQFDLDEVLSHNATEMCESESFLELGIIRCFEFVSALRRMSVIVRKLHSPGMEVFVKGAPEAMINICDKNSLPQDYKERLSYYTHKGYRVIACASKPLPNLTFVRSQRIKREQVESDLTFLGFIIFENKLKPTSAPVIATLSNARVRQVMCTGDNALTAISVSRECGLIQSTMEVYAPRFTSGGSSIETATIVWENIDDDRKTLDPISLKPNSLESEQMNEGREFPRYTHMLNDYVLAVTGDCFRWMVDFAPTSTLNRMLVKGQIFARMSPDEKHELVECLQGIGYCIGFCGDGANDCGALKAADVGISLSEAEASVAAPFTSRSNDIECVVRVIQEGRAALVTSFSCFKFMALYSVIQFTSVSFMYSLLSNIGDFQFLYIDVGIILPIAVFMGRTEAYPILSPKRPTANLVSRKVLTSLIGQMVIQGCIQATMFFLVRQQPWYHPPKYERGQKNIEGFENSTLFFLSIFMYLFVAVVFSVGPPYRKPMSSNRPFVFVTVLLVCLSACIVLIPPEGFSKFMLLVHMPLSFRLLILFMAGLHLTLALVSERFFFPRLATRIGTFVRSFRQGSEKADLGPTAQTHAGAPYVRVQMMGDAIADGQQNTGPETSSSSGQSSTLRASNKNEKKAHQSGKIYKRVEDDFNSI
ncbi:hypothetical protein KVV02_004670 [Mortierella alpina]|uniref:Cation-transporting ATPase n=1 Tax=Mortierella alpina TaxID=64518 RepID=A0A9P8A5N8_MORAP|nr:hypothetical protein KVV02_004670 [Mortierella alpina]